MMRSFGLSALLAFATLATASIIPTVNTRADAPAPNTFLHFRFQKDSYCTVPPTTPAGPCPADAEVIPITYSPNPITGWKEATLNVFNTRVTITNQPFQSPELYQVIIKSTPTYTITDQPDHRLFYTIDFEGTQQAYDYEMLTSESLAAVPVAVADPTIFRLIRGNWCLVDASATPQGPCFGVVPDQYALPFVRDNKTAEMHIKGHNVTVVVTPPPPFASYAHYGVFIDGVLANSLTGENDVIWTERTLRSYEWAI